jgi:transcriptional regulator with XRE-family HTH domain
VIVTSGMLIREARLLARRTQDELGARVGKDRAQIARWERGAVEPSFETLRELVAACGFELTVAIAPRRVDETEDAELHANLRLSPQERLQGLLRGLQA